MPPTRPGGRRGSKGMPPANDANYRTGPPDVQCATAVPGIVAKRAGATAPGGAGRGYGSAPDTHDATPAGLDTPDEASPGQRASPGAGTDPAPVVASIR